MQFEIKNINKSINDIMRTIGYQPAYFQEPGEFSIIRKLSREEYPRFHLYIKGSFGTAQAFGSEAQAFGTEPQDKLNTYVFNLHLDQKKPSYGGSHAHSGEYDGEIINEEVERIKSLLLVE